MEEKQVVFKLGNEKYGMNIMWVKSIEEEVSINTIPNAPNHIKGIINLRGEVIPVYSLRSKFGMDEKIYDENSRLLVTKTNDATVAFEVDSVDGIEGIDSNVKGQVPKIVKSESTSYIESIVNIKSSIVIILEINNIISGEEIKQIANILQENN